MEDIDEKTKRVLKVLQEFGCDLPIVRLPVAVRTAKDAARELHCSVDQIAKSLVFRGKLSGKPILIIASGAHRVNEQTMKLVVGEELEQADAAFVLTHTGFAIGGVAPVGHVALLPAFIDRTLARYEEIWAAGGTSDTVFSISFSLLVTITHGTVVSVT